MDIYYDDKVESIELVFFLSLKNNKFIFDKKEVDINNNKSNFSKLEDDILKFMIKNGSYIDDHYEYKIDNKIFKYYDEINRLILERIMPGFIEVWQNELNSNYLSYNLRFENSSDKRKVLFSNGNYSEKDKLLCDRFYNYLDKYILGKSN